MAETAIVSFRDSAAHLKENNFCRHWGDAARTVLRSRTLVQLSLKDNFTAPRHNVTI